MEEKYDEWIPASSNKIQKLEDFADTFFGS